MECFGLDGRDMNLATEGDAAPSQRDQQDGGAAGNWGVAGSAKERVHSLHNYSD